MGEGIHAGTEQLNSDLTAVDRAILAEVLEADAQGGINGRDLAPLVGVPSRSIGSRLSALTSEFARWRPRHPLAP